MNEQTTKRCTTCGRDLPVSQFYRDRRNRDGLYSECRDCVKARRKTDRPRARRAEARYRAVNLDRRRTAARESMRRLRAARQADK